MKMYQIIQKKRKELGMTQEQVANYLGVSTPAVNKWENGNSYPDIELLCPLARLLKVDVNLLLGFREELTKEEISNILQRVSDTIQEKGFDEGMKLAETIIREYPNCFRLIYNLALNMEGQAMMGCEKLDKYEAVIHEWYVRCTKSNDMDIRNQALHMLAAKYINKEEYEKGREYLDQIPDQNGPDKEFLKANILLGKKQSEEAAVFLERMVKKHMMSLQMYILRLIDAELQAGNIDAARGISKIRHGIAAACKDWEYNVYVGDFQIAVETKNVEDSVKYLAKMLEALQKPISGITDSPLFYRIYEDLPEVKKEMTGEKFIPGLLDDLKNNPMYDFLRENEEFCRLLEKAER